eukprot:CAMPEP_0202697304 /NCGR_PEP_ID=MMETSP1385-20130828/10629_1 /ASSEMBLY_ACC=CAM_ASM_000861 /TAXON_ID=933848 /ORGANISM="Elphidium margaritaceum" /LENGTH=1011 /DNA_ID=CAMNT_0049353733 /DNA_START=619 /DNA_END=3654 /DNA_ORIENTATION=-
MSHDSYSYRSPGPQSPVMHVASKAAKPLKSPPTKIYQVPSLLSKTKNKSMGKHDTLDIGMTTLSEHDDDADFDFGALLPTPVHRQYSEPDAKTMRDLEHLPPTPPFGAMSPLSPHLMHHKTMHAPQSQSPDHLDELGLPSNLQHAKTTPLAYNHEHAMPGGAYHHVNAHFYGHPQHQHPHPHHHSHAAPQPYAPRDPRNFQITDQYDAYTGYTHYSIHANSPYAAHVQPPAMMAAGKTAAAKTRKKKKSKKQSKLGQQQQPTSISTTTTATSVQAQQQQQQQQSLTQQQQPAMAITSYDMSFMHNGFDFAVHDLNQRLVAIKQELNELERQIMSTDNQTKHNERSLQQTTAEKKKVLHGLQMEKMVLQKSLDMQTQDGEQAEQEETSTAAVIVPPSKVKVKVDTTENATTTSAPAEEEENKGEGDNTDLTSQVEAYDDVKISEFWSKQCQELRRELEKVRTKNRAAAAASDVMHKHLRGQLDRTQTELQKAQSQRGHTREKNMQFELEVIELTEIVNTLKESVDTQRHDNFLKLAKQREREKLEQAQRDLLDEKNCEDQSAAATAAAPKSVTAAAPPRAHVLNIRAVSDEYPPEMIIQHSLIRAQTEFYFSDYNLKRDKRLLEKICKEPRRGYLAVDEVLNLSRVRQLCTSDTQLFEALKSSPYIDMTLSEPEQVRWQQPKAKTMPTATATAGDTDTDTTGVGDKDQATKTDALLEATATISDEDAFHPLFIGRKRFIPPSEKQFPFRRSVYIYGLPVYADEKYIYDMLNAFGGVTKVQFDHGPDTLDRQIMQKMLEKHRVYKLLSKDSAALTMEFNQMANKQEQYNCYWCKKLKPCADGYYHPKRMPATPPSYRVCLQCAAAKAEEQSHKYDARSKLLKDDKRLRELLLGLPPRSMEQCQTALCVFASQRQASKCVYVRSRLAYDGAFATHYHHYSKLKKEIAMSIKPKIRIIAEQTIRPPMLQTFTAPVYQQEGTAVIQPHSSATQNNPNTTTHSDKRDNDDDDDEATK